jgi:hypothetical protein
MIEPQLIEAATSHLWTGGEGMGLTRGFPEVERRSNVNLELCSRSVKMGP